MDGSVPPETVAAELETLVEATNGVAVLSGGAGRRFACGAADDEPT